MFSLLPYEKYNWLAPAAQPLIPEAASLDGSAGNSGATLPTDATAQGSHLPTSGLTWYGGGGSDDYSADDADNTLDGGAGSDEIHGNGGNDIILDGDGFDVAYGGAGNDLFIAEDDSQAQIRPKHDDQYFGGIGFDHISYERSAYGWVIDLADGYAHENVQVSFEGGVGIGSNADTEQHTQDTLESIEGATGGNFDDDITGNHANNLLLGLDGDDHIDGEAGDDIIDGGAGIDNMDGGSGIDTIVFIGNAERVFIDLNAETADHFAEGSSVLAYSEQVRNFENVVGSDNDDEILGTSGANDLSGGAGDDYIHGRTGDDSLKGNEGDDELDGGKGDDDLRGGVGDDHLIGGQGDDDLRGGAGNDLLEAGAGINTINGGAGDDAIWSEFLGTPNLPFFRLHGSSGLGLEGTDHLSILTATGGEGLDTFYFQDGESTTEMVITDFDDQEDTLAFHNITRKHFGPVTSVFEMFTIDHLDTSGDGRVDSTDTGWDLTDNGSSLRYETHYGASLVLEDVTSFEAEALEVRWFIG